MKGMKSKQGNGLGENNAKSWNPSSVPDKRGPMFGTGKVESHARKGAGQK